MSNTINSTTSINYNIITGPSDYYEQYLIHTSELPNINHLTKAWLTYINNSVRRKFTKSDLKDAISETILAFKEIEYNQFQTKIEYNPLIPNPLYPIQKFVSLIKNCEIEQVNPLDVAVIAQWIANIKRKIKKLKVYSPIVPHFYSHNQGTGKTTSIECLTSIIPDMYKTSNTLSHILIKFNQHVLDKKLVYIVDDIKTDYSNHGMDTAEMRALISGQFNVSLARKGVDSYDSYNLCSFISSGNHPINEVIRDSTGMRRFYQIDCLQSSNNMSKFIEEIYKIDYFKMYNGINPDFDYLKPYIDQLKKEQIKVKNFSIFQRFMYECYISETSDTKIPATDLYNKCRDWCFKVGEKADFSQIRFGKEMKKYNWLSNKSMTGWVYSVGSLSDNQYVLELSEIEDNQ